MQKYEYKFVEVPSTPENKENPEGFSPFKIIAQVVSAESHNGWRLKQIIEPKLTVMGRTIFWWCWKRKPAAHRLQDNRVG